MHRGTRRYAEGCAEVRGGTQRGVWRYAEGCVEVHKGVRGGTRRCAEVRGGVCRVLIG